MRRIYPTSIVALAICALSFIAHGAVVSSYPLADLRDYNGDLALACSTNAGKTILISSPTRTLAENLTCPANVGIEVVYGGLISKGSYTANILGNVNAGLYTIFSGTGGVTGLRTAPVEWFGADPTGTVDSAPAINAALAAAYDVVLAPNSNYLAYSTINVPSGKTLRGAGRWTHIKAVGIHGTLLMINSGSAQTIKDFTLWGNPAICVEVNNAQNLYMANINAVCNGDTGFKFTMTWGSYLTKLSTGGGIKGKCFDIEWAFNANYCADWYTNDAGAQYNFYINSGSAAGGVMDNFTAQGGKVGMYMKSWAYGGLVVNGFYSEGIGSEGIHLGGPGVNDFVRGVTFNGASISAGTSTNTPGKAIVLEQTDYVTFNNPFAWGIYGGANLQITGGGGSGALASLCIANDGSICGATVYWPGTGYVSQPTFSIINSPTGTGATFKANLHNGKIDSIIVNSPGIGYSNSYTNAFIYFAGTTYNKNVVINSPWSPKTAGGGPPMWTYVYHQNTTPYAGNQPGIIIRDDVEHSVTRTSVNQLGIWSEPTNTFRFYATVPVMPQAKGI